MMAVWRLRNPGSFPPAYHNALRAGAGRGKIVDYFHTERAARVAQRDFNIFRYCLRNYSHPTSRFEADLVHRTYVRFNHANELWELTLDSRSGVLEDIASID